MKNLLKLSLATILLLCALDLFSQNFNYQLRGTLSFPNQVLANICGYWQNGQEYALVGGSKGLIIVDITNPASPQQIVQIPGPDNRWKEIKVYSHYAYVTTEGGQGLQVVDLSALPSPSLSSHFYTGDGAIAGDLDEIHALHIDVTKGFLYAFGGNLFGGAGKVFDLKPDPYNPHYVGSFTQLGYIHDGYADNDTLYACHINAGIMSIVDMSSKSNPVVLGTVETPGKFTHNAWITDDRKHVLTTDEAAPSFLTSYDVSDPEDIRELDRVSPNNGYGTYVHNTHIINDYAVTSWYTSGVLTVDAHRPQNLVVVGQYDTYAQNNSLEFDGCWGAFPYFPSGTVIASNIEPAQLFVLTPTYNRACYFEGKVLNGCNGQPLPGATVTINGGNNPKKVVTTKADGVFRTGQFAPGNFTATISAPGFTPETVNITLATGQVTEMNIMLGAGQFITAAGAVVELGTNNPVPNATIELESAINSYTISSDANGFFNLTCVPAGSYTATAGKWGYFPTTVNVNTDGTTVIELARGYYDDFLLDLGWTETSNAAAGDWELGNPQGTSSQGNLVNPADDVDIDNNDQCYMTANGGGQAGSNDVDDGTVTLISPSMDFTGFQSAKLSFYYWFVNLFTLGNPPNDNMVVSARSGNQAPVPILTLGPAQSLSAWQHSGEIKLEDYITFSNDVRIEFAVTDIAPGSWLEAAMDIFKVELGAVGVQSSLDDSAILKASPNPSTSAFNLQYVWNSISENPVLELRNLLGQLVYSENLPATSGMANFGSELQAGVYFATLKAGNLASKPIKLIKQ